MSNPEMTMKPMCSVPWWCVGWVSEMMRSATMSEIKNEHCNSAGHKRICGRGMMRGTRHRCVRDVKQSAIEMKTAASVLAPFR